jgi:hypothetical protein
MGKEQSNHNEINENEHLECSVAHELELMQEFMDTKVDSLNHTRKNLAECEDILSYL